MEDNNFVSDPFKTTHFIRELLGGLTQQEFATRFHISLATVKNWDSRECMPVYVYYFVKEIHTKASLLDFYRNPFE